MGNEETSERLAFRVTLRLRTTNDGGRHHPISNWYRAMWLLQHSGAPPTYHDGPIYLSKERMLFPGDAAEVLIFPLMPELWQDVRPGNDLVMVEGARVIGIARVIGREQINPKELNALKGDSAF
jgi:hypothetical protein